MDNSSNNKLDPQLVELIEQAPKAIKPQQDLWQGIEKQLDKTDFQQLDLKSNRPQHWRRLAIACMLLVTTLLANNMWQSHLRSTTDPGLLLTLADIRKQHLQQVEQLSLQQHVNWQSTRLSDPLEKGIEQLRQAAEQIYHALQQSPHDKELWQLWLWTHAKEIELLQQGQSLPTTPPSQGALI